MSATSTFRSRSRSSPDSDLASIVLDRVIPLDALVEEGIRPLAEGTARGKIVINPVAA